VILLEILETDLEMKFSGASDDVLACRRDPSENAGIGLGESLQALDEFGKIVRVLDLDGDLDDGRDRELHDLHVVSLRKYVEREKESKK